MRSLHTKKSKTAVNIITSACLKALLYSGEFHLKPWLSAHLVSVVKFFI